MILGAIVFLIMAAVLGDEMVDAIAYMMESGEKSMWNEGRGGMKGGDDWMRNLQYNYNYDMDSGSSDDWDKYMWKGDKDDLLMLVWAGVTMMWIFTGVRIFYNIVMFKFAKEGMWIQMGGDGKDLRDSHPCRQTTGGKMM